jgi:hypothetical protein
MDDYRILDVWNGLKLGVAISPVEGDGENEPYGRIEMPVVEAEFNPGIDPSTYMENGRLFPFFSARAGMGLGFLKNDTPVFSFDPALQGGVGIYAELPNSYIGRAVEFSVKTGPALRASAPKYSDVLWESGVQVKIFHPDAGGGLYTALEAGAQTSFLDGQTTPRFGVSVGVRML